MCTHHACLSRRRFLIAGAAAGLLAACGSGNQGGGKTITPLGGLELDGVQRTQRRRHQRGDGVDRGFGGGVGHQSFRSTASSAGLPRIIEDMHGGRSPPLAAILCDIRMPDGDGPSLYDWLLTHRPELATRIGFITGDTLGPSAGRFLARSGCPLIEKPFTSRRAASGSITPTRSLPGKTSGCSTIPLATITRCARNLSRTLP